MRRQQIVMMLGDLEAKFIDISKMERKSETIKTEIKLMDSDTSELADKIATDILSEISNYKIRPDITHSPEEGLILVKYHTHHETEDEFNKRVKDAEAYNANLTIRKQKAKEYLTSLLNEKD